jgi:hypothetical protein
MKTSLVILCLVTIFTVNAFSAELTPEKTKLHFTSDQKVDLMVVDQKSKYAWATIGFWPDKQPSVQCEFLQSDLGGAKPVSLKDSIWSVVGNGATKGKRTLMLFNSKANAILKLDCYQRENGKDSPKVAVSDDQILRLLGLSKISAFKDGRMPASIAGR